MQFRKACEALRDFPRKSPQDHRRKVVGMLGGEPLAHNKFPELVDIMCNIIARPHRGLWTSIPYWKRPHLAKAVSRLLGPAPTDKTERSHGSNCGYINLNLHTRSMKVRHQPLLAASRELIPNGTIRYKLIENCWLQKQWSGAITPKGFFFCEVAGALDMIFEGPGGLPIEPESWQQDMAWAKDESGIRRPHGAFAEQIETWCNRCGACVPLPGRADHENVDDITPQNLVDLEKLGSPRVKKGQFVVLETPLPAHVKFQDLKPQKYIKGDRGRRVGEHG
jgi:hypothetical protein